MLIGSSTSVVHYFIDPVRMEVKVNLSAYDARS